LTSDRVPAERADRLAEAVAGAGLDALVVGDLVHPGDSSRDAMADVTWLTGYTGTSGVAIVGAAVRFFVTDFRYLTTAAEVVPKAFEIVDATGEMTSTIAERLGGKVGIDESRTSIKNGAKLRDAVSEGVEIVGSENLVSELRRVKDESEIALIAEASRITDEAYAHIEAEGLAGRTERQVALSAEARMRELGADDPSFPSIVAAGSNGALPHAVPGERVIAEGEYVTVDMGAIYRGYCSDCTRTLVEGDPDPLQRQVYELVLAAQQAGLEAIRAGADGRAVDTIAREVIAEGGYGERFGHGLGHGVGIEVHEPPRLSTRSEDTLMAGEVVTVEPGVYVPGEFGIRVEDLVVVTEAGHRNLSTRPK
jgi:Xaa-Pro aminopeptidase